MCLLTMRDRLYLAPITTNPKRILDIGTGIGLWATDMGDKFPDAKVIGIDLSRPPSEAQPNNVEFVIDDAMSMWTYNDNFDFIHIRGLYASSADWPVLYGQIFDHLHPGGYLEQMEWSMRVQCDDGSLHDDSPVAQWSRDALKISQEADKTAQIAEEMRELIGRAGFVDIVEKKYKWPIGSWSRDPLTKKIGHWNLRNWEEGMEGWAMALYTRTWGVSGLYPCDVQQLTLSVVTGASS